jgi:hypothetical protein
MRPPAPPQLDVSAQGGVMGLLSEAGQLAGEAVGLGEQGRGAGAGVADGAAEEACKVRRAGGGGRKTDGPQPLAGLAIPLRRDAGVRAAWSRLLPPGWRLQVFFRLAEFADARYREVTGAGGQAGQRQQRWQRPPPWGPVQGGVALAAPSSLPLPGRGGAGLLGARAALGAGGGAAA